MALGFFKMHGCGNDYVLVDGFRDDIADPAALARRVSDRHYGVGSDGLVLVLPSRRADIRMRMWNPDGSEAEMCGNGIRCAAKLAFEAGYGRGKSFRCEVGREGQTRVLTVEVRLRQDGRVEAARVDMGQPSFRCEDIPVAGPAGEEALAVELEVPALGRSFTATCVSMGNPHAVIFLDADPPDAVVLGAGPQLERHEKFPRRANVGFAHVRGASDLRLRVYERGAGETLACGTGACAALVAAARTGRTQRRATVHLTGGPLEVEWSETDGHVHLTGPVVEVFRGELGDR